MTSSSTLFPQPSKTLRNGGSTSACLPRESISSHSRDPKRSKSGNTSSIISWGIILVKQERRKGSSTKGLCSWGRGWKNLPLFALSKESGVIRSPSRCWTVGAVVRVLLAPWKLFLIAPNHRCWKDLANILTRSDQFGYAPPPTCLVPIFQSDSTLMNMMSTLSFAASLASGYARLLCSTTCKKKGRNPIAWLTSI